MTINTFIIIVILLIYFISKIIPINDKKKNTMFLILSFVTLFIVLAIRLPISDMDNYFNYFDYLHNASFESMMKFDLEFLYKILNIIIGNIWFNKAFFMFVINIIVLIPAYYFIKRYSKNYLISILLFINVGSYYMNFFILRQSIAIGILLFSIKFIQEKKIWKFIICVLIATLFHKSSLIFIIAYFICNIKITNMFMFIWVIIYGLAIVLKNFLVGLLSNNIYDVYSNTIEGEGYGKLFLYLLILFAALFINKFIVKDNNTDKKQFQIRKQDDYLSIYYNLTFILIFFQILATGNSIICRMGNDFCNGVCILLPNVINNLKNCDTKRIITFMVVVMMIAYSMLFPSIIGFEIV